MAVLMAVSVTAACAGGGGDDDSSGSATAPETTVVTDDTTPAVEETTTLPPGATAGLDDYDENGEPDPTCGVGNFGAGLVLRIPCSIGNASEPAEGTTLVPGSLFGMPSLNVDLSGVSGNAIQGRDENGQKVVVLIITSDTLFDVGSADLGDPARETFDGLARVIQGNWPTAAVQVRGHTDATGSATANQTLSEQRAAAASAYMATKGIDGSRLSSVGLGSTVPIALETNPDGSDNPAGRASNRRVEFVVRVPS